MSEILDIFLRLGIEAEGSGAFADRSLRGSGEVLTSLNPSTGAPLARARSASEAEYEAIVRASEEAFLGWRARPAPQRGEVVRQLGQALREHKEALGALVSLEMGKIRAEGEGEVQEMIDICDFAVGLSRQLYGLSMHSERPGHRMFEQWHPLGPVGVITAFNFPVAVWAWNAAIALVCGDTVIWKPSEETPLTAIAVQRIAERVMEANGCRGVMSLCLGRGAQIGEAMARDPRLPLISATGSCRMGRRVAEVVSARLGRSLLELGGNNAVIVLEDADLDLVTRAVLFGAVGTAGQRCTSTRRLLLQRGVAKEVEARLLEAYGQIKIGDPLEPGVLMGPLIGEAAVERMQAAIEEAKAQGGELLCGGERIEGPGFFVRPALMRAHRGMPVLREETFAPLLYLVEVEDLEEAIAVQNDVPQGLSSAIFTKSFLAAERFLSVSGSDCGIANVNIGTSGAEIGGAFGGEKATGGGREAGSDSWKQYMRRQTCTLNYSRDLPLAQGIEFG